MDSLVGTTIGGFKLVNIVGTGTTGTVFASEDKSGDPIAVKTLHPDLSLFTRVESFWDEVQAIAKLNHPNITVPAKGDWSKAGRFYMVMDLLEGVDLASVLADQTKLSGEQALAIVEQVCDAVGAVHDSGAAHGGLKPNNIFLLPDGDGFSVRVLDFGTAGLLEGGAFAGKAGPGTPEAAYLAPEQFDGDGGAASDVYSLGTLLLAMLSGETPYSGGCEEVQSQQKDQKRPQLPDSIGDELAGILMRALAHSPDRRYADAGKFWAAVASWKETHGQSLAGEAVVLFAKKGDGDGVAPSKDTAESAPAATSDKGGPAEEAAAVKAQPTETKQEKHTSDGNGASAAKPAGGGNKRRKGKRGKKGKGAKGGSAAQAGVAVAAATTAKPTTAPPAAAAPAAKPVNGESIEDALDAFIERSVAWSTKLPPQTASVEEVEKLAQPPKPKPKAAPVVAPVAVAAPVAQPAEEEERKSPLPLIIIAFVVGIGLTFGLMKMTGPGDAPQPVGGDDPGASAAAAPAEPGQPAPTDEQPEPAPLEPKAAPLDEAKAAATAPADEQPKDEPAAGDQPKDQPAVAADQPDAGPATEPIAAKTDDTPKPATKKPVTKKVVVKKPRKPRKPRKPAAKAPKKPKKPRKPKKPAGGNWVDPFAS